MWIGLWPCIFKHLTDRDFLYFKYSTMDTTVKKQCHRGCKMQQFLQHRLIVYSNLEYVTTLQLTYREDSYVDRAWGISYNWNHWNFC